MQQLNTVSLSTAHTPEPFWGYVLFEQLTAKQFCAHRLGRYKQYKPSLNFQQPFVLRLLQRSALGLFPQLDRIP
jgi:hypothetical protein